MQTKKRFKADDYQAKILDAILFNPSTCAEVLVKTLVWHINVCGLFNAQATLVKKIAVVLFNL